MLQNSSIVKFSYIILFMFTYMKFMHEMHIRRPPSCLVYLDCNMFDLFSRTTRKLRPFVTPGLKAGAAHTLQNQTLTIRLPFDIRNGRQFSTDSLLMCRCGSGLSCLLSACHLLAGYHFEPRRKQAHSNRNQWLTRYNQLCSHHLNCNQLQWPLTRT